MGTDRAVPSIGFSKGAAAPGVAYAPALSLRPIGQWKTFHVSIPDLKNRKREVELIFPPGDGAIYIQTGK